MASAVLAGLGHHLASGEPVAWRLLLIAAGVAFLGVLPWTSRPRSLAVVVAGTCAAQLVLHEVLAQAGPDLHATHAGEHQVPVSSTVMLGAHALAALAVAVLLHQADDQLAVLPEVLSCLLVRWLGPWRTDSRQRPALTRVAAGARPRAEVAPYAVLAHVVVRRGPPVHGLSPSRP
ncbi:hypothetical protein [Streptomyces sp. NPDC020681]|uniref:hypothetical protein n=1 Tax=Streptomyces sp. NPDC020681 TaxID=3365083 RepID=UPI00378B92DB